jgi:transcriptional regulator with XRE-family HTH domain
MNKTIFTKRLKECRRAKYSSQQAFADAYVKRFGMIRDTDRKVTDSNMFGTVQSWEQGKSRPTADVLANICELLDCDADYLIGRIGQRTHGIEDAHNYTGLSAPALEKLHEYREMLIKDQDWHNDRSLDFLDHPYYRSFALILIDEILTGSATHELSGSQIYKISEMVYEDGVATDVPYSQDEFESMDEYHDYQKSVMKDHEKLEIMIYIITMNIRDILMENALHETLPPALKIDDKNGTYTFKVKD